MHRVYRDGGGATFDSALVICQSIREAASRHELSRLLQRASQLLSLDYFAYASNMVPSVDGTTKLTLVDNYPTDFRDLRYARFAQSTNDPVKRHVQRRLPPLSWSSHGRVAGIEIPVPDRAKQILGIAGEHELKAGITVPIEASGERFALTTFATRSTTNERDLVPTIGAAFLLANTLHQAALKIASTEVIKSPLTPRELEVLSLTSQGRTQKEVARLLEISPKTAANHSEAARRKMSASTVTEAVRICVDLRLI